MDKLLACAKAFEKLFNTEYRIKIAHKKNQIEVKITFNKILKGKISYETIKSSRYIQEIENRFEPLSHLESMLDSNCLTFRYSPSLNPTSMIEADWLLSAVYNDNDIYIFLANKTKDSDFFCRSFFPKAKKDYTIGQVKYTLLYKEKRTVSTRESVVQYERK